jgi:hypothetical protein
VGREPEAYGIQLDPVPPGAFLEQILSHQDPGGADHDKFTAGLTNALKFYALGLHHDVPTEKWFDFPVPEVSLDRDLVEKVLATRPLAAAAAKAPAHERRALWLGAVPSLRPLVAAAGELAQAELIVHAAHGDKAFALPLSQALWLRDALAAARPAAEGPRPLHELEASWNARVLASGAATFSFAEFMHSEVMTALRDQGFVLTDAQERVRRTDDKREPQWQSDALHTPHV